MGVLEIADQSELFETEIDRWWVQYPVIYDIFSRLNRCNSFSRYRASLADSYTDRRKKQLKYHIGKSLKRANRLSSDFFFLLPSTGDASDFPLLFLKDASSLQGLCMPDCVLTRPIIYNWNNQCSCVLVGQMALLCGTIYPMPMLWKALLCNPTSYTPKHISKRGSKWGHSRDTPQEALCPDGGPKVSRIGVYGCRHPNLCSGFKWSNLLWVCANLGFLLCMRLTIKLL